MTPQSPAISLTSLIERSVNEPSRRSAPPSDRDGLVRAHAQVAEHQLVQVRSGLAVRDPVTGGQHLETVTQLEHVEEAQHPGGARAGGQPHAHTEVAGLVQPGDHPGSRLGGVHQLVEAGVPGRAERRPVHRAAEQRFEVDVRVPARVGGADRLRPDGLGERDTVGGVRLLPRDELGRLGVEDGSVQIEDDRLQHASIMARARNRPNAERRGSQRRTPRGG